MPKIDDFIAWIQQNTPQRTNRYAVSITKPSGGTTNLYADSVVLPGRQLATVERRIWGPQKDLPYERLYSGDLELNVLLSAGGPERTYFEEWMNDIIDPTTNLINSSRSSYAGEISITLNGQTKTATLKATEVYPKSIGTTNFSQAEENSYAILPVSLSFREYEWSGTGEMPKFDI